MTKLEKLGLQIKYTKKGLFFDKNTTKPSFQEKNYFTYKNFFENQNLDNNKVLYYIYRNVSLLKDSRIFKLEGIRYDLTLIFPNNIGREVIHTIGHFHKKSRDGITYPEIYQVIRGQAIFILQSKDARKFYYVLTKTNDKIIIPPGFGHITVNKSNSPLIIANLFTNKKNVSDYSVFKKHHGPKYYPIQTNKNIKFEKNRNYNTKIGCKAIKIIPKIPNKFIERKSNTIYEDFIKNPHSFEFLTKPRKFLKFLTIKNLYNL